MQLDTSKGHLCFDYSLSLVLKILGYDALKQRPPLFKGLISLILTALLYLSELAFPENVTSGFASLYMSKEDRTLQTLMHHQTSVNMISPFIPSSFNVCHCWTDAALSHLVHLEAAGSD